MKKVTAWEVAMGIALVFMGWTGIHDGEMYRWGVSIMYPRQFGWALIVLGVGIPVAAYIMRSRQGNDK
ncbi:MAG: hypothetical protein RDU24_14230 [Humidesulfovibrio sp.]|uniref:hypothetical protein n=1 Tax=Humidesulfovibrio sp. TaxID=2910988 RepID=UPI0027E77AFB|nr:hypothetical protein [Humidesulfovibrio sp.]MDQ7836535.1 hypothetical protein [Humidesulfovibrio sp.]